MVPSGRRRKTRTSARKPRKPRFKNRIERSKNAEASSVDSKTSHGKYFPARFHGCSQTQENESVSAETNGAYFDAAADATTTTSGCSTPKGERFRIPEILTCPPAPMKRRDVSSCSSLRRKSPIAFFAPPEIELFFLFALGDIPA